MLRAASLLALGVISLACNSVASLEDCTVDADCAALEWCHPEGHFCERDRRPVRIGVSLALSGDLSEPGQKTLEGFELAQREIQASGGILGRPLELVVIDDKGNVEPAKEAVRTLVEERGVVAVLGPVTSAQALETFEITRAHRVLEIAATSAPTAKLLALAPNETHFFAMNSRRGLSAAMTLLASEPTPNGTGPLCASVVVVHANDGNGIDWRDGLRENLPKRAVCVEREIAIAATRQTEYGAAIDAVLGSKAGCVFVTARPEASAAFVRELRAAMAKDTRRDWSKVPLLGSASLYTEKFLTEVRSDPLDPATGRADGMLGVAVDSTPPTQEYAKFRAFYTEVVAQEKPVDPASETSRGYDALIGVALAIERAGSTHDRRTLPDAFRAVTAMDGERRAFGPRSYGEAVDAIHAGLEIHYLGAASSMTFGPDGFLVSGPTEAWRVERGRFVHERDFASEATAAVVRAPAAASCGAN
jgi:branched-chain amino acid transport system substrate-binding protein